MHASHDSWVLLACLACGGNVFFDKKPHILFRRYNTNTSIDGGKLKSRLKYEFRYFEKWWNSKGLVCIDPSWFKMAATLFDLEISIPTASIDIPSFVSIYGYPAFPKYAHIQS